ncbi:glycoside hydrolase family 9 protein [Cytophagaceae bacterium ABcell3]|nr:glycoside hydrolase family 9 protein [Cytophagaceae bacterium ABcell3]
MRKLLIVLLIALGMPDDLLAQAFDAGDYQKSLWMTTRFYGAQRSGYDNWTLYNHLPDGVPEMYRGTAFIEDAHSDGTDLVGGWHDCGDHVKFGQTQFFSAYMLLKGYSEFKAGYDDYYSYSYDGYKVSDEWHFEGSGHDPNCIPDVLDEVKHATDYFLKTIPDPNNFYFQVGVGGCPGDHCRRETATLMQTNDPDNGGQPRPAFKNPNDASMASFCGATLALMSRMYRQFDEDYADQCLQHALYAYEYASENPGTVGSEGGGHYPANEDWRDDYVTMCAELYWATGDEAFRDEAIAMEGEVTFNEGWSFDYSNNGEIAIYNLALLGSEDARTRFNNRVTSHFIGQRNADGLYNGGGDWGMLRYNGNAAFMIGLYSVLNDDDSNINYIFNDIDYIMGNNSLNLSFISGFAPAGGGYSFVQQPHHRNAFLNDENRPGTDNTLEIPEKNRQFGALVGGNRDPNQYQDVWNDYVNTEICIDYNAGLVGALGYINSLIAPVDTTKFCGNYTCESPDLGKDISICEGIELPVTLDANTTQPSDVTFVWYKDGEAIAGQDGPVCEDCGTEPATYVVVRDSAEVCSKSDTLIIRDDIPNPDLGDERVICTPASHDLAPLNPDDFPEETTWQWAKTPEDDLEFDDLENETDQTLEGVSSKGIYRLTATLGECSSYGTVEVTSDLPTPVDACIPEPGEVTLSIAEPGLNGENYNWYTSPEGGTAVCENTTSCTFEAEEETTLYVQDMSSVSGTVGPDETFGTSGNWGCTSQHSLVFNATTNFTLHSFMLRGEYNNSPANVSVEILNSAGAVMAEFTTDNTPAYTGSGLREFVFNDGDGVLIDVEDWGNTLSIRLSNCSEVQPLFTTGGANFPYTSEGNIVTITEAINNGTPNDNDYMFFHNWEISTGTSCDRLPVTASIGDCPDDLPVGFIYVNAEALGNAVNVQWGTSFERNHHYYEVQRSSDNEDYQTIGTVYGAGNTDSQKSYSFRDEDPHWGRSYYRIANIDVDGSVQYSKIVTVNKELKAVKVHPNPSAGLYTVMAKGNKISTITVSDLSGKVMYTVHPNEASFTVDVQDIPAGVYLMKVSYGGLQEVVKVVKQ